MRTERLVFSLEGQLLPVSVGILLPLFVEELLQFACPLQLSVFLGQLNLLPGGWEGRGRRERGGRYVKDRGVSNKSTKIAPIHFLMKKGFLPCFTSSLSAFLCSLSNALLSSSRFSAASRDSYRGRTQYTCHVTFFTTRHTVSNQ